MGEPQKVVFSAMIPRPKDLSRRGNLGGKGKRGKGEKEEAKTW
jgi:hypothetical protein